MDWSNPLTSLRLIVAKAVTSYQPIVNACGGVGNIQVFDQDVDLRKSRFKTPGGTQLQLNAEDGEAHFDESSSGARLTRYYSIEIRKQGLDLQPTEWFEWRILRALAFLYMNREPGSMTPITPPAPLSILQIKATRNDRELMPVNDPEEWSTVCMIVVHAEVSFAAMTTAEPSDLEP